MLRVCDTAKVCYKFALVFALVISYSNSLGVRMSLT